MSDVNNPFLIYAYAGPKYFCDRIEETEHLISALRNGRNVTLMSPRRMGKTGLIQNVFHQIRRDYPEAACFYMDIFSTTCLDDFIIQFGQTVIGKLDNLSQKTLAAISGFFKSCRLVFSPDVLTGVPQATLDFQPSQAQATLKEIFDYLEHSGKECYIAIDEFQQITEYPEKGVEGLLRSYIQFLPHVHFIFSGSKQHLMAEMFGSAKRPFYRSTEKMNLTSIPLEDYSLFAIRWMQAGGKDLSDELFQMIYQRFNGHTWYIQSVFYLAYYMTTDICTAEIIRNAIEKKLDDSGEIYESILYGIPEKQRGLLKALACEGKAERIQSGAFIKKYNLSSASSVQSAAKRLLDSDLITTENNNFYSISDRFLAMWLKRKLCLNWI